VELASCALVLHIWSIPRGKTVIGQESQVLCGLRLSLGRDEPAAGLEPDNLQSDGVAASLRQQSSRYGK
jgi:hypothetical protein